MKKKSLCVISVLIMVLGTISAQSDSTESRLQQALKADFSYKGDAFACMAGGNMHRIRYLGLGTVGMEFNTERANWWKGGVFRVSGSNAHGRMVSEEIVGSLFMIDNIETSPHTFLAEALYKQTIGDVFDFSVGLQEFNSNFDASEEAGIFLNSSLGVNTVISGNIPVPTFPQTAIGMEVGANFAEKWRWQGCVYDGYPSSEEEDPHNAHWDLSTSQGFLVATELHYSHRNSSIFKLGAFYHTDYERYGAYAMCDYSLSEKTAVFSKIAYAPKKRQRGLWNGRCRHQLPSYIYGKAR